MATVAASNQRQARESWVSSYPMEIANGGLGVAIDVTTSSQRIALTGDGNVLELSNDGVVAIYVAWGNSSVTATTSHYRVLPGETRVVSIPRDPPGTTAPTHVAAISALSSTPRLMVYLGFGN